MSIWKACQTQCHSLFQRGRVSAVDPQSNPTHDFACSLRVCITLDARFSAACVFDTACWHTAMDNSSSRARQSVILGYNTVVPRRCTGEMIPPNMLEALEAAGRLRSPTRRHLLAWGDGALLGQRGDWRGLYDEGERGSFELDRVRASYFR